MKGRCDRRIVFILVAKCKTTNKSCSGFGKHRWHSCSVSEPFCSWSLFSAIWWCSWLLMPCLMYSVCLPPCPSVCLSVTCRHLFGFLIFYPQWPVSPTPPTLSLPLAPVCPWPLPLWVTSFFFTVSLYQLSLLLLPTFFLTAASHCSLHFPPVPFPPLFLSRSESLPPLSILYLPKTQHNF